MTFKTISDTPQTFTFTYDFSDIDTARVASHAVLGYMTGTYHAPALDATIIGGGQLVLEYAEDSNLNKIFKRICDGFKDYYTNPEEVDTVKEQYRLERVAQLKQSETFDSLLNKLVACELELMELADGVLDDDLPDMAVNGVHSNLEAVDDEAVALLKSLDTEGEYKALWQYASR